MKIFMKFGGLTGQNLLIRLITIGAISNSRLKGINETMRVGDLVRDMDGYVGIVVAIDDAYDLYDQLLYPEVYDEESYPLGYKFITVFCFHDNVELIFFDSELEVISQ